MASWRPEARKDESSAGGERPIVARFLPRLARGERDRTRRRTRGAWNRGRSHPTHSACRFTAVETVYDTRKAYHMVFVTMEVSVSSCQVSVQSRTPNFFK